MQENLMTRSLPISFLIVCSLYHTFFSVSLKLPILEMKQIIRNQCPSCFASNFLPANCSDVVFCRHCGKQFSVAKIPAPYVSPFDSGDAASPFSGTIGRREEARERREKREERRERERERFEPTKTISCGELSHICEEEP
jgi:hypothetical protein